MIDGKVEGTLPNFDVDLEPLVIEQAADMEKSIKDNFDAGGRPEKWPNLKKGGESHLRQSGALFNSIHSEHGKSADMVWAEAGVYNGPIYAAIHQYGGVVQHPGSDKFQAFQIGEKWIYTHHTAPHPITIPMRKYVMWQQEDIERAMERFRSGLFKLFDSKKVQVNA